MTRNARKPSPGYGHQLIRLERPRAELCQNEAHVMREAKAFADGQIKAIHPAEQISHICQWRYRSKGVEVIMRRWVCRGCAIAWARTHIWSAKAGGQKAPFTELKGAG